MKSIRTGNQDLVKQINKSIVFHTIKKKGPISRAQISKDTGLNKATVSTMVSELINESFVNEIGSGKSSGGRKPVMLVFNHVAGYAIGIDLGVNYLSGVLTDLNGHIIEKTTSPLHSTNMDDVTKQIFACIAALIEKAPESPYGIVGIGIGVPGQVDQHEKILFAPHLNWKNVDLKKVVEDRFQISTSVENEANAGAVGELLYGAGKGIANQVYVSIGIGIGTGIIIRHQLFRGTSGISGEMGHMTINFNGKKCSCGNRGCWELYASESALLEAAQQQNIMGEHSTIDLNSLQEEAQKGNLQVLQLLNTLGNNIGIGITNIVNTFNPEMVIIGNRISQFERWIINPIKHTLDKRLSAYHKTNTDICFSILGNDSTALGANSFAINNFFAKMKIAETKLVQKQY